MPRPLESHELLKVMFDVWADVTELHLQYDINVSDWITVPPADPAPDPNADPEPDPVITPPRDWPDSDESLIYDCIGDMWDPFTDPRAPDVC